MWWSLGSEGVSPCAPTSRVGDHLYVESHHRRQRDPGGKVKISLGHVFFRKSPYDCSLLGWRQCNALMPVPC